MFKLHFAFNEKNIGLCSTPIQGTCCKSPWGLDTTLPCLLPSWLPAHRTWHFPVGSMQHPQGQHQRRARMESALQPTQ